MSALRAVYLGLAIWGAVHPMAYFIPWLMDNNFDVMALFAAWKVSFATTGLVWDLVISAVALTLWIVAEVAVRRNWSSLVAIPATFLIGVSCGLPLYLFLRSRPVR
ncbi:DUF2834 domain-containing protein [Shimia litoralis]|uniref:DUF2834 domain-containing protein n=1 Tax=Shimia litoralis TaxID=420403 RepID=A0A4U7N9B1_9RHOB|nr:DUF2834 domain-containing protein [Shimia litoralis]TKZ22408.1 DUF2834 domain-containing protein [Shimia litoralis]